MLFNIIFKICTNIFSLDHLSGNPHARKNDSFPEWETISNPLWQERPGKIVNVVRVTTEASCSYLNKQCHSSFCKVVVSVELHRAHIVLLSVHPVSRPSQSK